MSIPFSCSCGRSGNAKDALAGKTVKCPACGNSLQILERKSSPTSNDPHVADSNRQNPLAEDFGDLASLERSGNAVESSLSVPESAPGSHVNAYRPGEASMGRQGGHQNQPPQPAFSQPQDSSFSPNVEDDSTAATSVTSKRFGSLNKAVVVLAGVAAACLMLVLFVGVAVFLFVSNSSIKLKGHHDGVLSVAYSSDGNRLVSASRDGTVKIWDANSGELITSINESVDAASISPNGKLVVTAGNPVKLWDADTGKLKNEIPLPSEGKSWDATCVSISPDGKWLAAGGRGGMAIWSLSNSDFSEPAVNLRTSASCLAFSPDSSLLAVGQGSPANRAGSTIGDIELIETESGKSVDGWGIGDMMGQTSCIAFSKDGKMLAVGTSDTEALVAGTPGLNRARSELRVWAVPSGQPILTVSPKIKQCTAVFFADDSRSVVVAGGNPFVTMKSGAIKRFDIGSGELTKTIRSLSFMVLCAAVSPDGKKLVWASGDMDTGDSIGSAIKRAQGRSPDPDSKKKTMERRLATMRFQISRL